MEPDLADAISRERAYLLRYASLQLRDRAAAEDAVQEALVAALAAAGSFGGKSALRTWLTGILKHKIIDAIRRRGREQPADDADAAALDRDLDGQFDARGHWVEPPAGWRDPDGSLENRQFMAALEKCLATLPPRTAQAFLMREHLGMETAEICKELGLTSTNCWVMLHRARMALRACLETGWFAG